MTDYTYSAELVRVVDGDTYDLDVDLGFHTTKRIRIRMVDIDTHETYGVTKDSEEYQQGIEEKRFVEEWFDSKDAITVRTFKDEKGKYGRWLARIFGDGEDLNKLLDEKFDVGK